MDLHELKHQLMELITKLLSHHPRKIRLDDFSVDISDIPNIPYCLLQNTDAQGHLHQELVIPLDAAQRDPPHITACAIAHELGHLHQEIGDEEDTLQHEIAADAEAIIMLRGSEHDPPLYLDFLRHILVNDAQRIRDGPLREMAMRNAHARMAAAATLLNRM